MKYILIGILIFIVPIQLAYAQPSNSIMVNYCIDFYTQYYGMDFDSATNQCNLEIENLLHMCAIYAIQAGMDEDSAISHCDSTLQQMSDSIQSQIDRGSESPPDMEGFLSGDLYPPLGETIYDPHQGQGIIGGCSLTGTCGTLLESIVP